MVRLRTIFAAAGAAVLLAACSRGGEPRAALDRFFGSQIRKDYAATYDCYDGAYRAKVSRDEYVRHRAEASTLESYQVLSLEQRGDQAHAAVVLVFAASPKVGRLAPASTTVQEDLVRGPEGWRVRVW